MVQQIARDVYFAANAINAQTASFVDIATDAQNASFADVAIYAKNVYGAGAVVEQSV